MESKNGRNSAEDFTLFTWMEHYTGMILPGILMLFDYFAIVGAALFSYGLRKYVIPLKEASFEIPDLYFYLIIPLVFMFFLHFSSTYIRYMPSWKLSENVFKAMVYATITVIMVMFFGGAAGGISRVFMILQFIFSFCFILSMRHFIPKILRKTNLFQIPVVFVGAGKTAELVIDSFVHTSGFFYKIKGFIDDAPVSKTLVNQFGHLGKTENAASIIREMGIQYVVITAPGMDKEKLVHLIGEIQPHVKELIFVPDLLGIPVENLEVASFFNEKLLLLKLRNNLAISYNRFLKKSFDFIVGSCIFVFVIPVLIFIALAIKMDSAGPIFYLGKRIGKNGEEFVCYKFRSMYLESDCILEQYLQKYPDKRKEWETFAKLKDYDPRVTAVGKRIRRFSLDELPQILNVIIGNMSLVGPRPYLPREKNMIGDQLYTITLTTPGITGFWQVSGRNEIAFTQRVLMDAWYVKNWSIWMDVVYLFKTIGVVLNKKGAY